MSCKDRWSHPFRYAVCAQFLSNLRDTGLAVQVSVRSEVHHAWYMYLIFSVARFCSTQVLADVRGNHDNYNVPLRGAPGDYYTAYGRTKELVSARATVKDVLKDDGAP